MGIFLSRSRSEMSASVSNGKVERAILSRLLERENEHFANSKFYINLCYYQSIGATVYLFVVGVSK